MLDAFVRATKNPAKAGFFAKGTEGLSGLQRLDARGQAGLVTGGLVLVDQAAGGGTIPQRLRHFARQIALESENNARIIRAAGIQGN